MITNTTFLSEDEYYNNIKTEVLNEGLFKTIIQGAATLLGYTGLFTLGCFGATLIAKSAVSKEGKINKFFKRIFGKKKNLDFDAVKGKPVVKREIAKAESYNERLREVFDAVEAEDWDNAERAFKASNYTDNVEAIKAVALKITDKTGEPPLFVYPQGNNTYFLCKRILGMKYAKALAQSVLAALKQNKSYYDDVELNS
jgi:hypothetical protein